MAVLEDFEDGNLNGWTEDDSAGAATVTASSTRGYSGSYSAEWNFSDDCVSGVGLSNTNITLGQGDTFSAWFYGETVHDCAISLNFGYQDTSNYYQLKYVEWKSEFRIDKQSGGNGTTLTSTSGNISSDQWVKYEIDWATDGTITATLDGTTITATDTEYTTGGVGFNIYNGCGAAHDRKYWDYLVDDSASPPTAPQNTEAIVNGNASVDVRFPGSIQGIDAGFDSSNLTFYKNQWNGSSNAGEVDIDGTQFTTHDGTTRDITPVNNGVAMADGASTEQYLMYSKENVHTRMSNVHSGNCDHVVGVRYNNGWEYDANGTYYSFNARNTDVLLARLEWGSGSAIDALYKNDFVNWNGDVGNYRLQMLRDGGSWKYHSGTDSTPASGTSRQTLTANSDQAYSKVIGIDSSFKFRVRAENNAGNSSWTYSSTVYTDPVPPHSVFARRGRDFTEDFEDSLERWFGAGEITTARASSGSQSLLISGSSKGYEWHPFIVPGGTFEVSIDSWCANPSNVSNHHMVTFHTNTDAADPNWSGPHVSMRSNGNIQYYDGSWQDTGYAYPASTWVSVRAVMDTSAGTFDLYVDDGSGEQQIVTGGGFIPRDSFTNGDPRAFRISGADPEDQYFDNVSFSNTGDDPATSIFIGWTPKSDVYDGCEIQYRKDSGSGYGAWNVHETKGAGATADEIGLGTDARYQFRLRTIGLGGRTSEWVYHDYGNGGNVFFEENFEGVSLANYAGVTERFHITGTNGHTGDWSLVRSNTDNSHGGIYHNEQLASPGSSLEVSGWIYHDGNNERGGVYMSDLSGNGYVAYFDPGNSLHLGRVTNADNWSTALNSVSVGNPTTGWYEIVISTDGAGNLSAEMLDSSGGSMYTVSATDGNYDPVTGGFWYYDAWRECDDLTVSSGGTILLEDGFEVGAFDVVGLGNMDSGVRAGSSMNDEEDYGFTEADQGTYFLDLQSSDYVDINLGDLSGESDVVVKCAMGVGSMDTSSEHGKVYFYDGAGWNAVKQAYWEYNEQGWFEVTALIPNSYLSTDNRVRLRGHGGGGDYAGFDRVVVSDLLHEYTEPAAPTSLSLDTSIEDEVGANWSNNATFLENNDVYIRPAGTSSWNGQRVDPTTSYTWTNRLDGEKYEVMIESVILQDRRGNANRTQLATPVKATAITILPVATQLSEAATGDKLIIEWVDNSDNEDGFDVYVSTDGGTTWTKDGGVGANATSYTTGGYEGQVQVKVRVYTEDTSADSASITANVAGDQWWTTSGVVQTQSGGVVRTEDT